MHNRTAWFLGVAAMVLPTLAAAVDAQPRPNAVRDGRVEAELIARHTALVPGETTELGLRLLMDEGWHTYWKNPGDSGMATSITLDLPEGFVAHDIDWPAPEYFEVGGLASYAYEGEIVLPVRIEVPKDFQGKQVTLKATADWLVCKEQCEPGYAELSLTLPVARNLDDVSLSSVNTYLFEWVEAHDPRQIRPHAASYLRTRDHFVLTVTDYFPNQGVTTEATARFFPNDPMAISMSSPQQFAAGVDESVTLVLDRNLLREEPLRTLNGVLAYRIGDSIRFYEIHAYDRDVANE